MRIQELWRVGLWVIIVLSRMVHASVPLTPKLSHDNDVVLSAVNVCIVLGKSPEAIECAKKHGALLLPDDHGKQGIMCTRDDGASETIGMETFNLYYLAVVSPTLKPTITVLHVDHDYDIRECQGANLVYVLLKDTESRRASIVTE